MGGGAWGGQGGSRLTPSRLFKVGSYAATNNKNPNSAGAAGTQYSSTTAQAYLPRTATADNTDWSLRGDCSATCTQRSTGVCSASFLASVIAGVKETCLFCCPVASV